VHAQHLGGDLDQVRAQVALVPLVKERRELRNRNAGAAMQQVERLGDELHVAVLDPVVHHLDVVPRAFGPM
jgi:hypothetical protein